MHINENFAKLPGSYLFSEIARRVAAYSGEHPAADLIRLGIGDVTLPLAPAVLEAMHKAVDEQGKAGEAQVRHHEVPYRRELARGGAVAPLRACGCHRR